MEQDTFEPGLNLALFASVDAYRVRLAGCSDAQQERKIPVPYNEKAGARLFKEENECQEPLPEGEGLGTTHVRAFPKAP